MKKYANGVVTKDNIIDVCKELFCLKGYLGTTYLDICQKTKIHPGSIKHHFQSKKNIATFIFNEMMQLFYQKTAELFPQEDDQQQVILAMGMYQKLLFKDAVFRRFTSEYSSKDIHASSLSDYTNTASKAYAVTARQVGKKKADFLFTAFKGMDCYIEPYINEHIDTIAFEDMFEYTGSIYYQYIESDELKSRINKALTALKDIEITFDRFDISIVKTTGPNAPKAESYQKDRSSTKIKSSEAPKAGKKSKPKKAKGKE
jgi:AcrR family transcriptional regulator